MRGDVATEMMRGPAAKEAEAAGERSFPEGAAALPAVGAAFGGEPGPALAGGAGSGLAAAVAFTFSGSAEGVFARGPWDARGAPAL